MIPTVTYVINAGGNNMSRESKETLNSQWSLLKPIILTAIVVVAWSAISLVNTIA